MLKRAYLSVKRRKTKTIIFFLFLFIVANLVLSAISIKNATSESMKLARQSLGSEVTLAADMQKLREEFMSNNQTSQDSTSNEDRKEQMDSMHSKMDESNATIEDVNSISKISYVKDVKYNFSVDGEESSFTLYSSSSSDSNDNESEEEFKVPSMGGGKGFNQGLQIEAINTFKLQDDYVNKTIELVEGKVFEEDDTDKVIISYELATANSLSVNDTIKVKDSSENEHELTIIGIYQNSDSIGFNNNYNKIYINAETGTKFMTEDEYNDGNYSIKSAVFYLDDPENADAFIKVAKKKITDLSDRYLTLDIDTQSYDQMVSSIEGVAKFSNTILIIVTIAAVVVISLMVINSLKDRNYELGVLLALGEKKRKIVGQFILELAMIAAISFILSIASSMFISQKLADVVIENQSNIEDTMSQSPQGGRGNNSMPGGSMDNNNFKANKTSNNVKAIDSIDVNVNGKNICLLFVLGYGIIFVSMLIPSVKILNSDPKDILSRKD